MKYSSLESPQPSENLIVPENTLFYGMQQLTSAELKDEGERSRLVSLVTEKMRPENMRSSLFEMIRCGQHTKDFKMLRFALETLQRRVHEGSQLKISPVSDEDLGNFLQGGTIVIRVGTGTYGHRLILSPGELRMPFDEKYSGQYAENFRNIFGLGKEDKNLTVSF